MGGVSAAHAQDLKASIAIRRTISLKLYFIGEFLLSRRRDQNSGGVPEQRRCRNAHLIPAVEPLRPIRYNAKCEVAKRIFDAR